MPLSVDGRVARDDHGVIARLNVRRLALAAVVLCLLLVCGAVAASGAHWYRTSAFFCLWSAARFVDDGLDEYDRVAWRAATAGLFPDLRGGFSPASCPGRYGYPLWTAALMAPFGLLARRALLVGGAITTAMLLALTLALRLQWVGEWSGEIVGRRIGIATLLPTARGLSETLI